jgi:lysophospholipase L1-like esterase
MSTKARIGARITALLLALGAAVVLVELALRIAFPAQTKFYVWPPRMRKALRPDPATMPGVAGSATFTVSSLGVRGRELGPDPEHRILAIGGSTTECLYLDDAEAWPAVVNAALPRTADGRAVWIGNVGKAGTTSRDHVLQLDRLARQIPRIETVTALAGVNDVTVALASGDHYTPAPPLADPAAERRQIRRAFAIAPGRLQDLVTDELGPEDAPLYKRTALYQLVKRTRAGVARRALAQDDYGAMYARWRAHRRHASARLDAAPDLSAPLADYRKNLEALADIAAARSIRLVLLTQPTMWRADLPAEAADLLWLGGVGSFQEEPGHAYYTVPVLAETMARFNAVMLDVCRARGLPCLDLAAEIRRDPSMFYDDCHFTGAGSRAVAAAVARHLKALPPFVP